MFIKIIKVKKSKILANKRSGLQNPTSIGVLLGFNLHARAGNMQAGGFLPEAPNE